MFPENLDFEKPTNEIEDIDDWLYNERSFLYDFKEGDFVYEDGNPVEVTGREAIEMWVEKALRTRIYSYEMYDETDIDGFLEGREYGSNVWSIINGRKVPELLLEAETKRDIEETLAKNDKIRGITDYNISRDLNNSAGLIIKFTVVLVNNEQVDMEVEF